MCEVVAEGMDPDAEDSDGDVVPLWRGPVLDALIAKVKRMNCQRARLATPPLRLRVNGSAREWSGPSTSAAPERRKNARRPPGTRTRSAARSMGSCSKRGGRTSSS